MALQLTGVALVILAALAYLAWRGWRAWKGGGGCGNGTCGCSSQESSSREKTLISSEELTLRKKNSFGPSKNP